MSDCQNNNNKKGLVLRVFILYWIILGINQYGSCEYQSGTLTPFDFTYLYDRGTAGNPLCWGLSLRCSSPLYSHIPHPHQRSRALFPSHNLVGNQNTVFLSQTTAITRSLDEVATGFHAGQWNLETNNDEKWKWFKDYFHQFSSSISRHTANFLILLLNWSWNGNAMLNDFTQRL